MLKVNNLTWDEIGVENATFEDIDMSVVRRFIKRGVEFNRLPTSIDTENIEILFKNLELSNKEGKLTPAAVLLFGNNPTRFFGSSIFKVGRFRGEDPTDLIVHDFLRGNLFQMPDNVMDLLKAKYLHSPISYQGFQRIETLEIPEKAMREAINNAIIHRDYSSNASIEMRIYDNMITLWNPGVLEDLNIEDLKKVHGSFARNKIIADIFYRAGYIESWGRGTITIINETIKSGLPEPVFKSYQKGIEVVFMRNPMRLVESSVPRTQDIKNLSDRQQKVVAYVQQHGSISNKIYQELCEVSRRTATRDLQEMAMAGILQKEGTTTKSVIYKLIAP